MSKKSLIISSLGLKNISMNKFTEEDDFILIFGQQEFRLNSFLAEIFPPDINDENLDVYLEYIECCYHFSQFSRDFDFSSLIESIARNFYLIDKNKFLKNPRSIQFSIISNPHLTI